MKSLKVSILLPVYNGAKYLQATMESILQQDFYELIIQDDCSTDSSLEIIKSFIDSRLKIYKNPKNIGYPKNLEKARLNAKGDLMFLMGQDDLLKIGTIKKIQKIFQENPEVGALTRPYYWFENSPEYPNRAKPNLKQDQIISLSSGYSKLQITIDSLDQLSGLTFRTKSFPGRFHKDVFPCHIYPFLKILTKQPVYFLADYYIAVRTESSQTRFHPEIYKKSPLQSWIEMIQQIFYNYPYLSAKIIRNFVAKNYLGLFQIKNYGTYRQFLRESFYLIKYRVENFFSPTFWFIFIFLLITPKKVSIFSVHLYKSKFLKPRLSSIIPITNVTAN